MKPSPHTHGLCYNAGVAALLRVAAVCRPQGICAAACGATPRSGTSRAILRYDLGERASHVRTDRPHPAPPPLRRLIFQISALRARGAGLARAALRPPVATLPSRGFTPRAPVRGAFVLPATHDRGFATRRAGAAWQEPRQGAFAPLGTLTRAIAPLTTRRRLPRPGAHGQSLRALDDAQEAFMPLHPDGGYSSPSTHDRAIVPVTITGRLRRRKQEQPHRRRPALCPM